mmetsp:Transcript_19280/g.33855  ORF Transcript_19280/g.33855 Transcript_19280/m.33855 type:complete len:417 (+) Transcript_19280:90-1340(+)
MSQKTSKCASYAGAATTTSSSHTPSLLKRIRALDKSAELSQRYTALVLFHPCCSLNSDNGINVSSASDSLYVAVGHAETSFINSTLIHCKNEDGDPIFVKDKLPNEFGVMTEVLRLHVDLQTQKDMNQSQGRTGYNGDGYNSAKLFQNRTSAFEHVTNHLLTSEVIPRKHADVYPICPFVKSSTIDRSGGSEHDKKVVLAHVNRSTAPYLGIDCVGVHLHCYVCRHEEAGATGSCDNNKKPTIKGVWLAKRAPTKSYHPNYWDTTVAGGQPANLSLIDNTVKEAQEEAGVPAEWIQNESTNTTIAPNTIFPDHTHDPLTMTTAKPDGTCLKRSVYYSCDLQVPHDWTPTPVDGEVSEFKLYSMKELDEELRFGNSVRPAMRAVLLDFMMRHGVLMGEQNSNELRDAMRQERLILWR